eukprot:10915405-Alexandrium_andersonii.AAC.1
MLNHDGLTDSGEEHGPSDASAIPDSPTSSITATLQVGTPTPTELDDPDLQPPDTKMDDVKEAAAPVIFSRASPRSLSGGGSKLFASENPNATASGIVGDRLGDNDNEVGGGSETVAIAR